MKNKIKNFIFLASLIIIYSCGSGANRKEAAFTDERLMESPDINAINNESLEKVTDRKIIRQGEITFETGNIKETGELVSDAVREVDGYLSDDNIYSSEQRVTHRLIIRVPSDKFDILLNRISGLAEKLDSRSVTAQDVTEEYIDVESRIRTKKELEKRYSVLLEKAKSVEDILAIEKEMGTLRTEIESIEGRLQYLKDRVSFSSLTVEFYQRTNAAFDFSSKFGQALVMGWKWLLAFIIGLVHLWPFVLIISGGLITGLTIRNKRQKRKMAVK